MPGINTRREASTATHGQIDGLHPYCQVVLLLDVFDGTASDERSLTRALETRSGRHNYLALLSALYKPMCLGCWQLDGNVLPICISHTLGSVNKGRIAFDWKECRDQLAPDGCYRDLVIERLRLPEYSHLYHSQHGDVSRPAWDHPLLRVAHSLGPRC